MNKTQKLVAIPLTAVALLAGGAAVGYTGLASAATTTVTQGVQGMMGHRGPGVFGTVASINGNTITVTGANSTTYTIDATNAKVVVAVQGAAPAQGNLASIKMGDKVGVRGTLTGTSVVATEIMDGLPEGGMGFHGEHGQGAMGTVSAINGNTITLTGKDGTTYTVDVSSATVTKMEAISVSNIQVGDTIGVDGTVSGTSITAKHIMDGVPPTAPQQ